MPCAFNPTRKADMLKYFEKHKTGKEWVLQKACESAYVAKPRGAWNEAVARTKAYKEDFPKHVWAFVLTPCCRDSKECHDNTVIEWKKYEADNIPLILFDQF